MSENSGTAGNVDLAKDAEAALAEPLANWGATTPHETLSADEKLWGMLANLLGLCFLVGPVIALVLKGSSKFVKFNAIQMIGWSLAAFVISSVFMSVGWTMLTAVPSLGMLIFRASQLLSLGFLGVLVLLALKANSGVIYRLPVIGAFAHKQAYGE